MVSEQYRSGEEVDLRELFYSLWSQKFMIVGVTLAFLLAASLYAFTREPVYQADLAIVAPSHNDIAALNYGRGESTGLPAISVREVYDIYTRHLQSEGVRRKVFEEVYLPALSDGQKQLADNVLYKIFSRAVVVTKSGDDAAARYAVSVTDHDPQAAVKWSNAVANAAGLIARDELVKNVVSDARMRASMLNQEISGKRDAARKEREDRTAKLKEALTVALAIGLKKPPIITGSVSELSARMDEDLTYMRGSDAIQAEIENLAKRQSDDPFIRNLRDLEERMAFYSDLKIDESNVRVYRQDGVMAVPDQPIKPRKVLILAGGLVVGGAIGVFVALVRFFVRGKKARFA
ncbi:TPA: LPS O-antigen chain length determinant protein WzzB [Pseudomonas putida]|nr:LPS O-antigen chain length determinant protein WzzB [Pseudomonas putida]